jgi:HAD superfamily hydrolase (TIGR01509 family)
MIRAVIFDLDGVLFDGCEMHANIFMEALWTVLGKSALTKEHHDAYLNGLSTKKKLEFLGIGKEDSQKIYDIKQELTRTNIRDYIHPDLKVQEICKTLLGLDIKIYCVSNSIRETIVRCLEGMGVLDVFSGIISNEDVKEPKPSPEPYLTLFQNHALNPDECLIVEDSEHGLESARKSGGHVLHVANCKSLTLEKILQMMYDVK